MLKLGILFYLSGRRVGKATPHVAGVTSGSLEHVQPDKVWAWYVDDVISVLPQRARREDMMTGKRRSPTQGIFQTCRSRLLSGLVKYFEYVRQRDTSIFDDENLHAQQVIIDQWARSSLRLRSVHRDIVAFK
jgi:hypothetical protein